MSCDMKGMPLVNVARAQVDSKLPCTVCYEEFKINERALQLPCSHLFHESCITTWLTLRNTCPNCRMTFDHEEDEEAQNNLNTEEDLSNEDLSSLIEGVEHLDLDLDESILDAEYYEDYTDTEDDIDSVFDMSVMDTSGEDQEMLGDHVMFETMVGECSSLESEGLTNHFLDSTSNISLSITLDIDWIQIIYIKISVW